MSCNTSYQPLVIETFNRELCLALAAMTDRKKPIIGEWVVAVKEEWDITVGKLYKIVDGDDDKDGTDNHYAHIIDDAGDLHHFTKNFLKKHFRKATVEELIKHFAEEKPFVLPELWYCPYENREQFEVMKEHFGKDWTYCNPNGFNGCTNKKGWNNFFFNRLGF